MVFGSTRFLSPSPTSNPGNISRQAIDRHPAPLPCRIRIACYIVGCLIVYGNI
jgi:hypothetical protein